jgi:tetratricopeptide (TPR) repeat protein
MSRGRIFLALLAFASAASAWQAQAPQAQPPKNNDSGTQLEEGQLPPDEDKASKAEKQYSFNPLQSKKEVTIGEFYFKKSDYRAAASRFREATKWNDGNAEAWLRLGDAEEKMKDSQAAHEAWEKYLKLAPEAKNAAEIRKKLEKLKS